MTTGKRALKKAKLRHAEYYDFQSISLHILQRHQSLIHFILTLQFKRPEIVFHQPLNEERHRKSVHHQGIVHSFYQNKLCINR